MYRQYSRYRMALSFYDALHMHSVTASDHTYKSSHPARSCPLFFKHFFVHFLTSRPDPISQLPNTIFTMKAILSTIAAGAAIVAATPIAYNNAGESQLEKRCSPFDTTPTIYANSSSISYSEGTNWHLITTNYGFDKEG